MRSQAIERTLCKSSASTFFVALFVLLLSTGVSAEAEDPNSQYQMLEWRDLVAQGWHRPWLLTEEERTAQDAAQLNAIVFRGNDEKPNSP